MEHRPSEHFSKRHNLLLHSFLSIHHHGCSIRIRAAKQRAQDATYRSWNLAGSNFEFLISFQFLTNCLKDQVSESVHITITRKEAGWTGLSVLSLFRRLPLWFHDKMKLQKGQDAETFTHINDKLVLFKYISIEYMQIRKRVAIGLYHIQGSN